MVSLELTTTLLGIGLAVVILMLVRRDHLQLRHGLFWIFVAVFAAMFGIWPILIDVFAGWLGVRHPPNLLFLIGVIAVLIKALLADINSTRIERQVRRLNQRIAIFEAQTKESQGSAPPSA